MSKRRYLHVKEGGYSGCVKLTVVLTPTPEFGPPHPPLLPIWLGEHVMTCTLSVSDVSATSWTSRTGSTTMEEGGPRFATRERSSMFSQFPLATGCHEGGGAWGWTPGCCRSRLGDDGGKCGRKEGSSGGTRGGGEGRAAVGVLIAAQSSMKDPGWPTQTWSPSGLLHLQLAAFVANGRSGGRSFHAKPDYQIMEITSKQQCRLSISRQTAQPTQGPPHSVAPLSPLPS